MNKEFPRSDIFRNADAMHRRHLKIMRRLKRFYLENYCYFITSNCYRRRRYFKKDESKDVIIDFLKYYRPKYGFKLKGFAILEDHFHILIVPTEKYNISWIMKSLKVAISKRVKRKDKINDPIWQHRFYDHIVRNEQDFKEILHYIHNNPGKHNLCESLEEYRYSSFRNYYLNDHSLIEIDMD
jgi:putative transposase